MGKKRKFVKKILHYLFITTVFVILSLICFGIILYASGYRLNLKTMKLQKTGLLLIDYPKNKIEIYIDGEEKEVKRNVLPNFISAPYSITMLPGEYYLELKKDQRITFAKDFIIEPELITKIEDIYLPPQKIQEELILEKEIYGYEISPNDKQIVFTNTENQIELYSIDKQTSEVFDDLEIEGTISSYTWGPNSQKILLEINQPKVKYHFLLDTINSDRSFYLHEKFSYFPLFDEIFFSSNNPKELFGVYNRTIYSVNLASDEVNLIDENVTSIKKTDRYIYYVKKDLEKSQITQLDTNIYKKNTVLKNIDSTNVDIIPLINNRDILIKKDSDLYRIKSEEEIELIDQGVENIFPDKNNRDFYYTKGYELWFYNQTKKESILITRLSDRINQIIEIDTQNIIYRTDTYLGMIRLDGSNNIKLKQETQINLIEKINKEEFIITEEKESLKTFKKIFLD